MVLLYGMNATVVLAGIDIIQRSSRRGLFGVDLENFFRGEGSRVGGTSWWPGTNFRTELLRKYRKSCAKDKLVARNKF